MENKVLHIGTYNVRLDIVEDGENAWMYRRDAIRKIIEKYHFDIIGLQEVRPSQHRFFSAFPSFELFGDGRDDDEYTEYVPILYNANKLKLIEGDTFWLSETPEVMSIYEGAAYHRICTWGKFDVIGTDEQFIFMNTHLDHISSDARRFGVQTILDFIARQKWEEPIMLVGDFNATPAESWFKDIVEYGFSDARVVAMEGAYGPEGTCTNIEETFNHEFPLDKYTRIDYIFLKGNLSTNVFETITNQYDDKYSSDHLPLVARISLF